MASFEINISIVKVMVAVIIIQIVYHTPKREY